MVDKVLLLVRSPPYGRVFAAEALRAGIAFAGMDLSASIVFIEDGVFCLMPNQNPSSMGMTDMSEGFKNAEEFGLSLFVHEHSLIERSISGEDIGAFGNAKKISDSELRALIERSEAIIYF